MKLGTVCRCQCGREYVYRGGRPNRRCPDCYRKIRLDRVKEAQKKVKRRRSGTGCTPAPQKSRAQKLEVKHLPVVTAEETRGRRKKIPEKRMQELMKDPVFRLVHEIEEVNREREKQGLRPLDYGEYVWKFGK